MTSINFGKRVIGGKKQRGQGMTEYIIIVALVAIAAIGIYSVFGRTVKAQMAQINSGLAGDTGGVNNNKNIVKTESTAGGTLANETNGLDVYGQDVKPQ
jgi:Flp pilus assembly pilin Flp